MQIKKSKVLLGFLIIIGLGFKNNETKDVTSSETGYQAGEKMTYVLKLGFIEGGKAEITLENKQYEGKRALYAQLVARTTGILDYIFDVEDIYSCYFDPVSCLPYKSIRNIREGSYKLYEEVVFNHTEKKLVSKRKGEMTFPDGLLDMVSVLYYIRNISFINKKEGEIIKTNIFFDDKVTSFDIRYKGTETIETVFGKIKCYKIMPYTDPGRVYKTDSDLTVWLSADKNMLPIKVKFDLKVGSIKCEIISYDKLKYPIFFEK